VHARFFDHAGLPKRLRWRSWTYCLPLHRQRRHPESVFYIAVEMAIADHPPHRSERALLTHSAPTSSV
jgi:hypothetical protein